MPGRNRLNLEVAEPDVQGSPVVSIFLFGALVVAVGGLLGLAAPRAIRLGALPLALAIVVSVALMVKMRTRFRWSPGWLDAALMLTPTTLLAGLGPRALDWPFFGPVGPSVDAAHHGAMVAWVARHGWLPNRVVPELRQFSEYFLLTHRVAGDASALTGLAPMRVMGLFGLVALCSLLVFSGYLAGLAADATGPHLLFVFGLVFCVALLSQEYTIATILGSYFLAQLTALWLCMAACICISLPSLRPLAPVLGGASMACYPLQAPIVPLILVGLWLFTKDKAWCRTLMQTLGVGFLGLVVQAPYLGGALKMSKDEGAVTQISLHSIGGPIVVVLLLLGLVGCVLRLRSAEGAQGSRVPILVTCFGFLATMVLYFGFVLGGQLGIVSRYSAAKIVFLNAPFSLALCGFGGLLVVGRLLGNSRVLVLSVSCAFLLVLPLMARSRTTNVRAPMDVAAYELSISLPKSIKPTDIGIIGGGLTPYFVSWAGLAKPVSDKTYDLLKDTEPWRRWPVEGDEHYLLVVGERYIKAFLSRPGVTVVRRNGRAALLRRSP
jgi:hypothetical protein